MKKDLVKEELKKLFKSLDFISKNFLNKKGISKKELNIFYNIYQQLGLAWEYLGLQCKHWDGYKKTKEADMCCKICGKIKGVDESYYMLPAKGLKIIGTDRLPSDIQSKVK